MIWYGAKNVWLDKWIHKFMVFSSELNSASAEWLTDKEKELLNKALLKINNVNKLISKRNKNAN